ncbi:MAG TPA: hypothetical protein VMV05_05360 [bacterium]|nr:hypothetical protein [bacterium]
MDAISRIDNLLSAFQDNTTPSGPPSSGPIAPFEQAIDKLVTAENNAAKAASQTAIKAAEIREDFARRMAFLSAQVHKAESALAALQGSTTNAPQGTVNQLQIDAKQQEILYWKSRLHQAGLPTDMSGGL